MRPKRCLLGFQAKHDHFRPLLVVVVRIALLLASLRSSHLFSSFSFHHPGVFFFFSPILLPTYLSTSDLFLHSLWCNSALPQRHNLLAAKSTLSRQAEIHHHLLLDQELCQ
jgi:hypothetical protein